MDDPVVGSAMKDFRVEVDANSLDKVKLETLLKLICTLMDEHDEIKKRSNTAWSHVASAQDTLEKEMLKQGITSFKAADGTRASIVSKGSCDYEPINKPTVFEFLRGNEGGDIISEQVRKDTLAKWLNEFIERGGKLPPFIELKTNTFLQIRR